MREPAKTTELIKSVKTFDGKQHKHTAWREKTTPSSNCTTPLPPTPFTGKNGLEIFVFGLIWTNITVKYARLRTNETEHHDVGRPDVGPEHVLNLTRSGL